MTLRDDVERTDRVTELLRSPPLPFLRFFARRKSNSRIRSNFRFERVDGDGGRGRMHAIFPFIRATHTYTQRIAGIASGSWNLKGRTRRANKFGVNSRFEKSGGIERRRKWWRQFYGNACGEGGEGSADICITRAPTRYRRVCKPAFLHLMYTFHVAANCTGRRRKDSGASARRYYVTCRSIMIPPSR